MVSNKTLVIHPGALGDVICALPAVKRFLGGPDSVDFVVESRWGHLLHRLGSAGRWYPLESALFGGLFSIGPSPRLRDILQVYGRIVVFSFSKTMERSLSRFLEAPVWRIPPRPDPSVRIHVTEYLWQHLSLAAPLPPGRGRAPSFRPEGTGAPRRRETEEILIHPGSGSLRKCWPLRRFLQVMDRLRRQGYRPVFLMGPAEAERFREFAGRLPAGTEPVVLDDALQLLSRIERAGALLGNDSGVTHLAAYCRLPTLALFGPSDPVRWQPRGDATAVMRGAPDCLPCFEIERENCRENRCLREIRAETVIDALLRLRTRS